MRFICRTTLAVIALATVAATPIISDNNTCSNTKTPAKCGELDYWPCKPYYAETAIKYEDGSFAKTKKNIFYYKCENEQLVISNSKSDKCKQINKCDKLFYPPCTAIPDKLSDTEYILYCKDQQLKHLELNRNTEYPDECYEKPHDQYDWKDYKDNKKDTECKDNSACKQSDKNDSQYSGSSDCQDTSTNDATDQIIAVGGDNITGNTGSTGTNDNECLYQDQDQYCNKNTDCGDSNSTLCGATGTTGGVGALTGTFNGDGSTGTLALSSSVDNISATGTTEYQTELAV